jgi:hypothetical protein
VLEVSINTLSFHNCWVYEAVTSFKIGRLIEMPADTISEETRTPSQEDFPRDAPRSLPDVREAADRAVAARGAKPGATNAEAIDEFNPEPSRERTRTRLTFTIVGFYLLSTLSLVILTGIGKIDISTAKELSGLFLTPMFGLAGTALGFYFGVGLYNDFRGKRNKKRR